ncbi:multidrug effflux MFS transporter [Enterovirga aerilata]|uniref:Bcr/CflA family efflux transporter n=1 Tax=Enterovirga aerilata TaxID=2730920 RepID=A0A849I508_9HYPH|nr:multidrug effflux MFS transporter [Enterovirga sp. DB1703]NNM74926.1 multidrug effflux MFS transporter [Enterovirga sp. DB1703]
MRSILTRPPFGNPSSASIALLVAITMTGTLAMHIFVPALPRAGADLGASPGAMQLTVTLYLVGLAAGQLVYGPISDRFGRRPVIIASLLIYLGGFLLAIPAASIGGLIVARVLQSLGGCGSLVIGRAMVRDVSSGQDAARQLALLTMAMSMTPALAPAIGGVIDGTFGWRAIFVALAGLVAVLLLLVLLTLPETNRRPVALPGVRAIFGAYARLARSVKFRRYTVAASCGGTSLYAFLAVAPFLIGEMLGRSSQEVGLWCLFVTVGMAVGSALVRTVAGRHEVRVAAQRGNLICLGAAIVLVGLVLAAPFTIWTLVLPLFAYAIGVGIMGPNAVAGLMNVDPDAAGSASSLYGFIAMGFGALYTIPVAVFHGAGALPMALTLLFAASLAAFALHRV